MSAKCQPWSRMILLRSSYIIINISYYKCCIYDKRIGTTCYNNFMILLHILKYAARCIIKPNLYTHTHTHTHIENCHKLPRFTTMCLHHVRVYITVNGNVSNITIILHHNNYYYTSDRDYIDISFNLSIFKPHVEFNLCMI